MKWLVFRATAACSMLFFLAACAASPQANQAPSPVAPISPGDRLRVTHNGECCTTPTIGIEESLSRDTLVLQSEPEVHRFAIARSNITQIERWNLGKTHVLAGTTLGFLAGAVVGGLIGYESVCSHCDGDWRPLGAFQGVMIGGVTGLVTGLLFGAQPRGFWETVP